MSNTVLNSIKKANKELQNENFNLRIVLKALVGFAELQLKQKNDTLVKKCNKKTEPRGDKPHQTKLSLVKGLPEGEGYDLTPSAPKATGHHQTTQTNHQPNCTPRILVIHGQATTFTIAQTPVIDSIFNPFPAWQGKDEKAKWKSELKPD